MSPCFADIIRSDQFEFLIGKEQTRISIHASALAATSPQIDRLMNGAMREAGDKLVELPDIGIDDFVRFCEYAYRGDYTTPMHKVDEALLASKPSPPDHSGDNLEPVSKEVAEDTPAAETSLPDDGWLVSVSKEHKTPKPSKKKLFRLQYQSRKYFSRDEYRTEIENQFEPQFNTSDEQDFTSVFLAHAHLYAFARMRLVDNLRALSLEKLHKTLVNFKLYENRVGDIIELARYAYSSDYTPDPADDGHVDELRDLVVCYIASKHDIFGKTSSFTQFLEEGGEFVSDFWRILYNDIL